MRKTLFRRSLPFLTALILCCSGCEKKADVIEEATDTSSSSTSSAGSITDNNDTSTSDDDSSDDPSDQVEAAESESWNEAVTGGADGFGTVTVGLLCKNYSNKSFTKTTIKYEVFNSDFAKKMCDTVFDSGEVEVYDYTNKTKRVYADLIKAHEDALKLYESCSDSDNIEVTAGSPCYNPMSGKWTNIYPDAVTDEYPFTDNISKLTEEERNAPETIENDYSYSGYIGKINGDEYYMYFGNRNYDEYLTSPDTVQFNGRVVTIMKTDLASSFTGDAGDMILQPNSIVTDYEYSNVDPSDIDISNDMISTAEAFLDKIGYGSYIYNPEETGLLYWGNEVSNGFLFNNGYLLYNLMPEISDGVRLRFDITSQEVDRITLEELDFTDYSSDSDIFFYDSYVDVFINSTGVLGCQIYNPATIIKTEPVEKVMNVEEFKDIFRTSVNDKSLWNINLGTSNNNFELQELKLIYFPLKSDTSSGEYELVPCYLLGGAHINEFIKTSNGIIPSGKIMPNPFLLVNATDGSFIHIDEELTDYPAGWMNGNVGYKEYYSITSGGDIVTGWPKFSQPLIEKAGSPPGPGPVAEDE